jgi:hypothetical protein
MWNLHQQPLMELRVGFVGIDHSIDHGAHEVIERRSSMFDELGFDHAINFLYVALVQGNKDCLLVWEVLVNRADAHSGNLDNAIGCEHVKAFTLQHSYDSIEHRIDSLTGAALFRLASTRLSCGLNGMLISLE